MSNFTKPVNGALRGTAIALSDLPSIANNTILGNNSGSAGSPSALTSTQVTALLNEFTSSLQGLVPGSGGGTTNFLRADGTWTAPTGTGITSISVSSSNGLAGTSSGGATPSLTLSTTVTGLLQGNGTAISAASTTGTGNVVLASSPTLVTPALGTPSALVGTNISGTGSSFTAGNINASSNSTLTTLSALSLPTSQLSGSISLTTQVSGTLPVGNGGTGDTSFTAYSVIAGGTTSGGALQNVSGVGTSGQVLTSNGASALPTWQPAGGGAATLNYFCGTFPSGSTWTASSTSFVNGTNSGGNALTTIYSSGLTVTAAASNVCGITFTPAASTSVYHITATTVITNNTAAVGAAAQIWDGTTVFGSGAWVQGSAADNYSPMTLSGIYAPGVGTAVTVSIQLKGFAGGSNAELTTDGAVPVVTWTIVQIK